MKRITLIVVLLCFAGLAKAQKKQNIYFLKNNGKHVEFKDSADFVRVIQEPDSGTTDFILLEQYTNGNPKARGHVSKFDPQLVYEGQLVKYSSDGKKESLFTYVNGKPVGRAFLFFSNGKVNKVLDYDSVSSALPISPVPLPIAEMVPHRLIYYADSLGNVMIENGNGHFKAYRKFGNDDLIEEGVYTGGVKDGLWTGKNTSETYWFKEKYLKGKFLSGESGKDGQQYVYALQEEFPTFKGGIEQFYSYVARTVRYPVEAQRNRETGKVFLSFVVEKDGSLTDIQVQRGASPSLNQEAIRVLKKSPHWVPGKQKGIPVRVKYNIPLTFTLNR